MNEKDKQELWQQIEVDMEQATPGERAIVGVLMLLTKEVVALRMQFNDTSAFVKDMANQFDRVSSGGNAIITSQERV